MFVYKTLPQNFKVRRLTFRNISKHTKTGVLQRILILFHRHYSLERNKKSVETFFRQFSNEENKKKSKQIGQEKVALTITGAGVVAQNLTFSNIIMLDGAAPAPRWLFDRWLAELLSGYETGHCGRPAVGFVYIPNGKVAHFIFSLWPFSSSNHAPKGPERKRNKPRCCWPAIFASILFSENEKGQRLRRAVIVHAHCTCHEQRTMSKLNNRAGTWYHLSSDFFDSLQRAEISIK